jgi:hypothetical protein
MPCYHPIPAYQGSDGKVVFVERLHKDVVRRLELPCGQCVGCRLERSRQWAVRCVHEASCHESNCFLTLTYSDDFLPVSGSLVYRDFQLFMKRLRKRFSCFDVTLGVWVPRFYMCGEYGDLNARPHFHACVFGFDFPDKVLFRRCGSGCDIFTSVICDGLWRKGFASVGSVTFESAAYVARYVMKKITGDEAVVHYGKRVAEFCHMSLKPGIGGVWFDRWKTDVYPHDYVVVNGVKVRPPKYYDKRLTRLDSDTMALVSLSRDVSVRERFEDNSDERLAVKEVVQRARLRFLRRQL